MPTRADFQPAPLWFRPLLFEKVWGGDRLRRFGKPVAAGHQVGESWEIADMAQTSASGAGGGAARSVVAAGPLAGRALADVRRAWGDEALFGRPIDSRAFPLLVKFLDARENLSVQVHPSPEYLARYPGAQAFLKTECWYVLDAEPGSFIYKGLKEGVTREDVARGCRDGSIVEMLGRVEAVRGECHNLPSGTVHALGAGVLVAEVQTPSDTTFRLYDWGRTGRELHVDRALESLALGAAPEAARRTGDEPLAELVRTEFFTLSELALPPGRSADLADSRCCVLMALGGKAELTCRGAPAHSVNVAAGMTLLIPAQVAPRVTVSASTPVSALIATVP